MNDNPDQLPQGEEAQQDPVLLKVVLEDDSTVEIRDPAVISAINVFALMSSNLGETIEPFAMTDHDAAHIRFMIANATVSDEMELVRICANIEAGELLKIIEVCSFYNCEGLSEILSNVIARKIDGVLHEQQLANFFGEEFDMTPSEVAEMRSEYAFIREE